MISEFPPLIYASVNELLKKKFGGEISIQQFQSVGGGCINNGGKLITSQGNFFLKWNDSKRFPGMFEAEAKGLQLLGASKAIDIPGVIGFDAADSFQFLLIEFREQSQRKNNFWQLLGEQLATLHQCTSESFGLDHNNYIGSLPQNNSTNKSWINFFIEDRLHKQFLDAVNRKYFHVSITKKFESLYQQLPHLLPEERPSLLHGDLWSGNVIINEQGAPCLIDPAVYYGNREVDLAMTQLFGGFDKKFLEAYNDVFPLDKGYSDRFSLYNLYPLLVHVNLFGSAYVSQVTSILNKYT
jgi:protein-ribulosamine 3-kinase